jgi:hypothetical protein
MISSGVGLEQYLIVYREPKEIDDLIHHMIGSLRFHYHKSTRHIENLRRQTNVSEIRVPIPSRGCLTIKEAKAIRCDNDPLYAVSGGRYSSCAIWHFTCRRCKQHLPKFGINGKSQYESLCDECAKLYEDWHMKRVKELEKEWNEASDVKRKAWLAQGLRPIHIEEMFMTRVGEWMRKCPIIDTKIKEVE